MPNGKDSETGPVTWSVLGQNIFLNTLLPSNTFVVFKYTTGVNDTMETKIQITFKHRYKHPDSGNRILT